MVAPPAKPPRPRAVVVREAFLFGWMFLLSVTVTIMLVLQSERQHESAVSRSHTVASRCTLAGLDIEEATNPAVKAKRYEGYVECKHQLAKVEKEAYGHAAPVSLALP